MSWCQARCDHLGGVSGSHVVERSALVEPPNGDLQRQHVPHASVQTPCPGFYLTKDAPFDAALEVRASLTENTQLLGLGLRAPRPCRSFSLSLSTRVDEPLGVPPKATISPHHERIAEPMRLHLGEKNVRPESRRRRVGTSPAVPQRYGYRPQGRRR